MRTVMELNKNWYFQKENVGLPQELPCDWAKVDLPHTWNAVDGQDGRGEYYRGACWYAKSFETPECMDGYRVYVEVLAAALSGRVYVNGQEVAYHEGGFSTFRADVTEALHAQGENLLVIEVDNGEKSHIYPQVADFTFYGGLYRGVNLILVPEVGILGEKCRRKLYCQIPDQRCRWKRCSRKLETGRAAISRSVPSGCTSVAGCGRSISLHMYSRTGTPQ